MIKQPEQREGSYLVWAIKDAVPLVVRAAILGYILGSVPGWCQLPQQSIHGKEWAAAYALTTAAFLALLSCRGGTYPVLLRWLPEALAFLMFILICSWRFWFFFPTLPVAGFLAFWLILFVSSAVLSSSVPQRADRWPVLRRPMVLTSFVLALSPLIAVATGESAFCAAHLLAVSAAAAMLVLFELLWTNSTSARSSVPGVFLAIIALYSINILRSGTPLVPLAVNVLALLMIVLGQRIAVGRYSAGWFAAGAMEVLILVPHLQRPLAVAGAVTLTLVCAFAALRVANWWRCAVPAAGLTGAAVIILLTMRPAWSWLSAADLLPWLPAFALLLPSLSTQQRRSAAALGLPLIFTLISCLLLRPPFHAWSAVPSASALAALGLWRWSGNKQGNPILTFGLLALGSLGSGCVIGFGAFRERGGANWLDLAAAIYSLIHRGATLTGITEVGWRSAAALALYLALLSLCGWLCLRLHTPPTQSYAALLIVAAAIAGVAATVSPAWNRRLPVMVIANARLTEHTPEWTALLAPPQPIRGIELISRAAHATSVPQGTLIARLTLRFTDGSRSELPIRAGIETAEYAFGRPDVQAGLLHQLTDVERVRLVEPIESKPFAGLTYRSLISLPGHRKLASLSARLDTRAVSGHGVELELDGVRCWSAMPTHLLPASPGRLRIAEHLELTARRPTVDVRPPFSLGEGQLRVSSRLANSANWPHGAQIGQIRMIDPTDSPSIRYWAGVDTAEWAVLRSDLLSRLAHMHPPGRQCGGERNGCGYISMRAIPSGKTGSVLVRITLDPRFAAVGGIWSIDSIDFVRGKLSKQLRATR